MSRTREKRGGFCTACALHMQVFPCALHVRIRTYLLRVAFVCWLSGKKTLTYVRTYARTAHAVQEPQYKVASSRLVNYQGAMADCTEASELFATIAVRSN